MFLMACLSWLYINILCRALKPRESKRLQAKGQWSIGALGGDRSAAESLSHFAQTVKFTIQLP